MSAQVEARSGVYGDVFFEDLADILHRASLKTAGGLRETVSTTLTPTLARQRSKTVTKLKRATEAKFERTDLLRCVYRVIAHENMQPPYPLALSVITLLAAVVSKTRSRALIVSQNSPTMC